MNSIDDADVPGILKQAFKDNESAIRKDEREKVLNGFCNQFWSIPIPEAKVDFVERVGEIIRSLRQQEQPK